MACIVCKKVKDLIDLFISLMMEEGGEKMLVM